MTDATKRPSCKDIPDAVFLRAVWDTPGVTDNGEDSWRMAWDVSAALDAALGWNVPGKLFRAKAARLIQRKLLDGCPCGCRGDYYLTAEGKAVLAEAAKS